MQKANILLIHTPIASPAIPSWNSAMVAGSLCGADINCLQYDANLDFFLNYGLSKDAIHGYLEMIEKKMDSGIIPRTDFPVITGACQRVAKTSISIDMLRTSLFYEPEKFLAVKKYIDDLLLCFSYTFFPYRIGWGSFFVQSDQDQSINPFILLCKQGLKKKIARVNPDVIVLFISFSGQAMAGKTMARFIKSNFPEKKIVLIKEPCIFIRDSQCFDHIFSMAFLDPFFKLIQTMCKTKLNYKKNPWPDFKSLPLKDYLLPDRVLPVHTLFFKDKKSFWRFLSNQHDNLGVKGFVLEDHNPGIENLLENKKSNLFFSASKSMDDTNTSVHCPPGLKMICWDSPQKERYLNVQALWDSSRQEVWNHVKIFGKTSQALRNDLLSFISSNPNIAHSFENHGIKKKIYYPEKTRIDSGFNPYSRVKPLPGEPFWKILDDPAYLLLYSNKYNKKKLFRMRADPGELSIITLGTGIRFYYKKPDDLPYGFLDEICRMVEAGGSVDTKYVRYNLERAYLIGYALENDLIVGNSSLKHPRNEFIQRINQITDMDFTKFLERGYTSVRPEYRALGVGARLLAGLTKRACDHKIFSIISEDNKATQKIALRNKTRKIATYYSEKLDKQLGVWMPEQMIPENWNLTK